MLTTRPKLTGLPKHAYTQAEGHRQTGGHGHTHTRWFTWTQPIDPLPLPLIGPCCYIQTGKYWLSSKFMSYCFNDLMMIKNNNDDNCQKNRKIELPNGHEYLHTECEYHCELQNHRVDKPYWLCGTDVMSFSRDTTINGNGWRAVCISAPGVVWETRCKW